jgi:hypothetical protein
MEAQGKGIYPMKGFLREWNPFYKKKHTGKESSIRKVHTRKDSPTIKGIFRKNTTTSKAS